MINPYENVNWNSDHQIVTTTHAHVIDTNVSTTTKQHFNNLYNGGVRCFAISNYYPSAPMYPLSKYTEEIDREIPIDIIQIPNAEHHNFSFYGKNADIHINSVGSLFSSGYERGISPAGYAGGRIEDLIKDITNNLLYEDGGGITINHPTWTYNRNLFSFDIIKKILDLSDKVLGIEIYSSLTWGIALWDEILMSGRKCLGFAVPDHRHKAHTTWYGRNVLIVPTLNQHECLKAIQNGNMYCKYANTDLAFNEISLQNNILTVRTNKPTIITFIADGIEVANNINVTSAFYNTENTFTYIRVKAETQDDKIFSEPIMFFVKNNNNNNKGKKIFKYI